MICHLCNLPIEDNQSRVMHYLSTDRLRMVHRKCRDEKYKGELK